MKPIFRLILVSLFAFNLLSATTPGMAVTPGSDPNPAAPQPPAGDVRLPISVQMKTGQVQAPATNAKSASVPVSSSLPTLGAPGLSYRFGQAFGTTYDFYTDDPDHLYNPNGLFATAYGVWVTEERGFRALKYDLNGNQVAQVGNAGHRYLYFPPDFQLSIENLSDAAVDAIGNLWLVDSSPNVVLGFAPDGSYLGMIGSEYNSGAENDRFNNPVGAAFDSAGRLYVSDQWNHRVQVFNVSDPQNPAYLTTIGVNGEAGDDNNHFSGPARIAIDASNRLYVVDTENQRVQILNVSDPTHPVYMGTLGTTGEQGWDETHLCYPMGVEVKASRIYVADNCNHRVQVFNRDTRALVGTVGTGEPGTGDSQLFEPQDVAVDANGLLYVADRNNHRVQIFNSDLAFIRRLGTTGVPYLTDNNHFNRPRGVAVDASGNIYLTEEFGQRLIKLSPSGSVLWVIGQAGVGHWSWWNPDPNILYDPEDVAISPTDGNVYVANSRQNNIRVYNPAGVYQKTIGTGYGSGPLEFGWINGIGFGPDGTLYVADGEFRIVKIYNANGTYRTQIGVSGEWGSDSTHFGTPKDVAVNSQGNIYVSDDGNADVRVFNKDLSLVSILGVTQQFCGNYGHLCGPSYLAIDRSDNVYVSSSWDHIIHIFDANGGFKGTLGGWGATMSNLANVAGLAIAPNGSLFAADYDQARLVRYDRGYPSWRQVNINGFGDRNTGDKTETAVFKDHFYAGFYNSQTLKALDKSGNWMDVDPGKWSDSPYAQPIMLYATDNYLYVSAWTGGDDYSSGQSLKRFDGTTWTDIENGGLNGDPGVGEIDFMQTYNNKIYAIAFYSNSNNQTNYYQVWSSASGNAGTWAKEIDLSLGAYEYIQAVTVFDGALCLGTIISDPASNPDNDNGRVWCSTNSVNWAPVSEMGFGNDGPGYGVISLTSYNEYLYAGVRNFQGTGAQLWRCQVCQQQSDWTEVIGNGFDGADADSDGTVDNYRIEAFSAYKGMLYAGVGNIITGTQVWRTEDGLNWQRVAANGFGYGDTRASYRNASGVLNDKLMFMAANYNLGVQVWEYASKFLFLPNIIR